jgi:hypothetical protein
VPHGESSAGGCTFRKVCCRRGVWVMLCSFCLCSGVESLRALYQVAEQRVGALERNGWFASNAKCSNPVSLELIHSASITKQIDTALRRATVLFAATHTGSPEQYTQLCVLAQKLQRGCVVISATTPLMLPCFGMLARMVGSMNWGETTFFLQRKL